MKMVFLSSLFRVSSTLKNRAHNRHVRPGFSLNSVLESHWASQTIQPGLSGHKNWWKFGGGSTEEECVFLAFHLLEQHGAKGNFHHDQQYSQIHTYCFLLYFRSQKKYKSSLRQLRGTKKEAQLIFCFNAFCALRYKNDTAIQNLKVVSDALKHSQLQTSPEAG